jgi:hypothetical protein
MKTKEKRFQCLHPLGKHAPSICADTYDLFEKAIVEILKKEQPLSFYDLVDRVKNYFGKNKVKFDGAVDWFGITVKNHLEATGIVETYSEKGKKLIRLKK